MKTLDNRILLHPADGRRVPTEPDEVFFLFVVLENRSRLRLSIHLKLEDVRAIVVAGNIQAASRGLHFLEIDVRGDDGVFGDYRPGDDVAARLDDAAHAFIDDLVVVRETLLPNSSTVSPIDL